MSGFEDGLTASFGSGWTESTDQLRGGTSVVQAKVDGVRLIRK